MAGCPILGLSDSLCVRAALAKLAASLVYNWCTRATGTGTLVMYAGGHLHPSGTPTRRVRHDSPQWLVSA